MTPPETPVFAEPWEATAFAMAVKLNERGAFTWSEWADALSAEIAAHPGQSYYESWLGALEHLVEKKALLNRDEREARIVAWDAAARATPHGQPIFLKHS